MSGFDPSEVWMSTCRPCRLVSSNSYEVVSRQFLDCPWLITYYNDEILTDIWSWMGVYPPSTLSGIKGSCLGGVLMLDNEAGSELYQPDWPDLTIIVFTHSSRLALSLSASLVGKSLDSLLLRLSARLIRCSNASISCSNWTSMGASIPYRAPRRATYRRISCLPMAQRSLDLHTL